MGRPAHGRATATASVRRVIQGGSGGLMTLSERHGIIPKVAPEWKKRIGAHGSGFDGFQPRIQGGDRRVARRGGAQPFGRQRQSNYQPRPGCTRLRTRPR